MFFDEKTICLYKTLGAINIVFFDKEFINIHNIYVSNELSLYSNYHDLIKNYNLLPECKDYVCELDNTELNVKLRLIYSDYCINVLEDPENYIFTHPSVLFYFLNRGDSYIINNINEFDSNVTIDNAKDYVLIFNHFNIFPIKICNKIIQTFISYIKSPEYKSTYEFYIEEIITCLSKSWYVIINEQFKSLKNLFDKVRNCKSNNPLNVVISF